MPHFAASDLVLHCLPMSNKHYARLMWVNASIAVYAVAWVYVTGSGLQKIDDHSKCMYVFLIS